MKKDIKTLLQSSDPAQRREAIITLGKTRDARALPILAKVYRSDPDPALRELAHKAGQFIQEHAAPPPAPEPPPAPAAPAYVPAFSGPEDDFGFEDEPEDAPVGYGYEISDSGGQDSGAAYGYGYLDEETDEHADAVAAGWFDESTLPADAVAGSGLLKEEVNVSRQNMERAKGYYNRAFDFHLKNDRASAAKELGRALEINPNLVGDATARNLAREITHREPDEALTILRNRNRREAFIAELQGKTRKSKGESRPGHEGVTWGDVGFDAIVYYLVNVIGVVVMFMLIWPMMTRMSYELSRSGAPMMTIGPLAAIGIGLGFGLYTLVVGFISNGAVHFTAVMFGGEGLMPESYHALFLPQTVIMGGTFALYAVMWWLEDLSSISSILLFGLSIGGLYWMSSRLASVHRFGAGKGCATIIVGPIILAVLMCLGLWVLTAMLGVTMQQFAPGL